MISHALLTFIHTYDIIDTYICKEHMGGSAPYGMGVSP